MIHDVSLNVPNDFCISFLVRSDLFALRAFSGGDEWGIHTDPHERSLED